MLNGTNICYLISLLFYGMGFSKMFDLSNAVSATSYFVFAIFFAIIGFLFYVTNNKETRIIKSITSNSEVKLRGNRYNDEEARAS